MIKHKTYNTNTTSSNKSLSLHRRINSSFPMGTKDFNPTSHHLNNKIPSISFTSSIKSYFSHPFSASKNSKYKYKIDQQINSIEKQNNNNRNKNPTSAKQLNLSPPQYPQHIQNFIRKKKVIYDDKNSNEKSNNNTQLHNFTLYKKNHTLLPPSISTFLSPDINNNRYKSLHNISNNLNDNSFNNQNIKQMSCSLLSPPLKIFDNSSDINNVRNYSPFRVPLSLQLEKKRNKKKFSCPPKWKKCLKGRLQCLLKNNIVISEKLFNPIEFIGNIANNKVLQFDKKFKNFERNSELNFYTNKFPSLLNNRGAFYSRYFDNFQSIDELIQKNFTKEEIFQIKADPNYFISNKNYTNVNFFQRRSLTQTLNDEEKVGIKQLVDEQLKSSLEKTKKKVNKYINYYTLVMSNKDFISYAKK